MNTHQKAGAIIAVALAVMVLLFNLYCHHNTINKSHDLLFHGGSILAFIVSLLFYMLASPFLAMSALGKSNLLIGWFFMALFIGLNCCANYPSYALLTGAKN